MSASSSSSATARRIKEGGGAGGKVTAQRTQKTLTPISEKDTGRICKRSTGKENSKHLSGTKIPVIAQKPVIRPLPRIDKQPVGLGKDGDSRFRWSTSSVPRGRSSSPSDFTRILSDFRKDRVSRVSVSDRPLQTLGRSSGSETDNVVFNLGKSSNGVRVSERCRQKKVSVGPNLKENEGIQIGFRRANEGFTDSINLSENSEPKKERSSNDRPIVDCFMEKDCLDSIVKPVKNDLSGVRVSDSSEREVNLNLDSIKSGDNGVHVAVESCKDKSLLDLDRKALTLVKASGKIKEKAHSNPEATVEEALNGLNSSSKGVGGKILNGSKVSDNLIDKVVNGEGKGNRLIKYPSKLHEKLAFLESKVKRIATDIKKTKEMLDMNNPDASKVILSDIQEKISGVEKAMGHVVIDADGKTVEMQKGTEKNQDQHVDHSKNSVKQLSPDELEARLFPHHKLLRNRTSLSKSSGSIQNHGSYIEATCESKIEDKSLSPIDENPIALEFLASLKINQSKISTLDEHAGLEFCEIQEMDGAETSAGQDNPNMLFDRNRDADIVLTSDEHLDDFDDQENRQAMMIQEEIEDISMDQLHEIGCKASTGGWFVEGESVLLAHDDGSCSFHDITNSDEKAEYKPAIGVSPNMWRDCWLIRAPGPDGCSGRYVVAASAGNSLASGFCSWDFYTKDIKASHIEDGATMSSSRPILGSLPNSDVYRRTALPTTLATENRQWWYKPCGPLIISTASCQRSVRVYDIRDGEQVMNWEVQRPVLTMDYSSPLQWRNRGKVVVAETDTIRLWDVNSLNPQALLSISCAGRKVSALHVNNTDVELGGGVRQRLSSSEAEGNDGVFCTQETINVLDFRLPSGVGLRISKLSVNVQSVFSRGDSIFIGCTDGRSVAKAQPTSLVQQFSLRKGTLVSTYTLPESNAHSYYSAITQVWGNSNLVMGVCGLGLFVFDTLKDNELQSCTINYGNAGKVRDIIGPDDLYSPSFDYLASRALVISRDRPAMWKNLS